MIPSDIISSTKQSCFCLHPQFPHLHLHILYYWVRMLVILVIIICKYSKWGTTVWFPRTSDKNPPESFIPFLRNFEYHEKTLNVNFSIGEHPWEFEDEYINQHNNSYCQNFYHWTFQRFYWKIRICPYVMFCMFL